MRYPSLKHLLHHNSADFICFGLADETVAVVESIPSDLPSRVREVGRHGGSTPSGANRAVSAPPQERTAELRAAGASPVHALVVAFDGKQVWVRSANRSSTPIEAP